MAEPFSQENQMLTPKMSLRRVQILRAHQGLIDGMYAGTVGFHALAPSAEKAVLSRVSKA